MKVKKLIRELKKMPQDLEVELFAHDHDPEQVDQGVGNAFSVWEQERTDGSVIVVIHA